MLLVGLAGLLLLRGRPVWGRRLLLLDLVVLYLLSLPPVALALRASLEAYPPLTSPQIQASGAQAIVVLGAGGTARGPDYDQPTPHWFSLVRARYAGKLQRETGLPVVVAGGGEGGAEGRAMGLVLAELGVPPELVWLETQSVNTQQNAARSAEILQARGLSRVFLVTQAYHMRRSVWIFRKVGLDVIPAPCDPALPGTFDRGIFAVLPQASSLFVSSMALEEWLANLFYSLRY